MKKLENSQQIKLKGSKRSEKNSKLLNRKQDNQNQI